MTFSYTLTITLQLQEMEVNKTRAFKLGILNEAREARKMDLQVREILRGT